MEHGRSVAHDPVQRWRPSGARADTHRAMRRLPFLACALTLLAAPAAGIRRRSRHRRDRRALVRRRRDVQAAGHKVRRGPAGPLSRSRASSPSRLRHSTPARPATFTFRVDGPSAAVRVRIELTRAGAPAPATRLRLGYRRTGVRHTYVWTPAAGELPAGEYAVALQAIDAAGHGLRRTARRPAAAGSRSRSPPPPLAPARRRLPDPGRLVVRRRGRALRRPARRPHPPGPGRHRRRGHAARRAGRVHRLLGRVPAPAAPATTSSCAAPTAPTTSSCTSPRARSRPRRARRSRPASSSPRSAARAPRRARTCTSRSGRDGWYSSKESTADRPPPAAPGVGGDALACSRSAR